MKRLIDEPSGPLEERAANLLQSIGPLEANDVARERVRRALDRPQASPRLRRPLVGLVGVLAFSASAAALWGGVEALSRRGGAVDTERGALSQGEKDPLAQEPQKGRPDQATPKVEAQHADTVQTPTNDGALAASEAPAPSGSARRTAATTKTGGAHAVAGSDAQLVQEAVEALRTRGDAARADELLEKYRKKGDGQLAEEALALSIEANLGRNPSKAQSLAREYSSKYPHGRFKSLAERALRSH